MPITWGRLTDLINNAKGLTYSDTLFFVFSLSEVQLFAIELNTGSPNNNEYGQLFLHGVDANDVELAQIGGEYSPTTVEFKRLDGLPFDRVTLYQEGDFYKSWSFVQKDDGFILRADTIKDGEDLRERWGDEIIGLNDDSIQKLTNEVLQEIIKYILRELLQ